MLEMRIDGCEAIQCILTHGSTVLVEIDFIGGELIKKPPPPSNQNWWLQKPIFKGILILSITQPMLGSLLQCIGYPMTFNRHGLAQVIRLPLKKRTVNWAGTGYKDKTCLCLITRSVCFGNPEMPHPFFCTQNGGSTLKSVDAIICVVSLDAAGSFASLSPT